VTRIGGFWKANLSRWGSLQLKADPQHGQPVRILISGTIANLDALFRTPVLHFLPIKEDLSVRKRLSTTAHCKLNHWKTSMTIAPLLVDDDRMSIATRSSVDPSA